MSSIGYVVIAFGEMNFCMRLREKMETYYEKEKQWNYQNQPEASIPLTYKDELSPEEKENILKDVYRSINIFEKLLHEAKKKSFKRQ